MLLDMCQVTYLYHPVTHQYWPFEYQWCIYASYYYAREPPRTHIYVHETENLATTNLLKISIVTTADVYIRSLFKCCGHQIRIGNILFSHQGKNQNVLLFWFTSFTLPKGQEIFILQCEYPFYSKVGLHFAEISRLKVINTHKSLSALPFKIILLT